MSLCMVFIIPSAYNLVLSCLTHLELVRASRICHHAHAAVESYKRTAFNINNHLSHFFDSNALAFRNLQARTETLVGGAAAFHFIERSSILPMCIELFVHPQASSSVAHWLLQAGYSFIPEPNNNTVDLDSVISDLVSKEEGEVFAGNVRGTLTFEKTPRQLTALVFIAVHCPVEIMLSSRSTCFFNAISWEKAYCIFPRASLHNRKALLIHDEDSELAISDEDQVKLRTSDFEVVPFLDEEDVHPDIRSEFPSGRRWINDSSSLCIHLDLADIEKHSEASLAPRRTPIKSPMDYCGFQLCVDAGYVAHVKFAKLVSTRLQYTYTLCDSEMVFQVERSLNSWEATYADNWMDHKLPNVCESVVQDSLSSDYRALECLQ